MPIRRKKKKKRQRITNNRPSPVLRPRIKYEKRKKRKKKKKKNLHTKHKVRDELLSYLEHERKSEKDREAFVDSEYWHLLESREKRNVKRTFKVERRRANDRIVSMLQSYRPSYVESTGQVAGSDNMGMFGLQNLMSSPLRSENANVRGHGRRSIKKNNNIVHIKRTNNNNYSNQKKKKKGKNSVLTYLKFEGVSDSEYDEEEKERGLHDDIKYNNQIDPQEDVNNQYDHYQTHQRRKQVDMGDENLLNMYPFLQKDANVIARFKTPPMAELYANAAIGSTPNSSVYDDDGNILYNNMYSANSSKRTGNAYTPDLPYTPEEQIPPQHLLDEEAFYAYNNNADLMMMDGINMAAMNMNDNYYHNDNVNHQNANFTHRKRKNKRNKRQNRFKPSPIKKSLRRRNKKKHSKSDQSLLNSTFPRRRKTNFSRLREQRKIDSHKSAAEFFAVDHPLKGSVKAGKRLSNFKYKPIVEWDFPRGYKRPWEKPITKQNLKPNPEPVTGHDFEFYGKKLNGQSPLLTIPPRRKPILPLKQHRGNKIEEAAIMDRLNNEEFDHDIDNINEKHCGNNDQTMMLHRISDANSKVERPEFSQKRGPRGRKKIANDNGEYELSQRVLSDANENRHKIRELQRQIQLARDELEEVERKNLELDLANGITHEDQAGEEEEEEEEEDKLANVEKLFKNLY